MNFAKIFTLNGNQVLVQLEVNKTENKERPEVAITITTIVGEAYMKDFKVSQDYLEGKQTVAEAIHEACGIIDTLEVEDIRKDVAELILGYLAKTKPEKLSTVMPFTGVVQ